MKAILLGGTKGMGRALARELAGRGAQIALLGRNLDDVQRSATDLEARGASGKVAAIVCDLELPETFAPALDAADEALGGADLVIVTAALFGLQDDLIADLELTRRLLTVNLSHTIVFCEHARTRLMSRGGGTLCVFSSVAGDRGRKPVGIYGASKAGLSHYLESLDHRYRAEGLVTICVKPGFVKTGMTEGLDPPPFAGEPEGVARSVMKAIDKGKPMIYAPMAWGGIMAIIKRMPRFVMRRINF